MDGLYVVLKVIVILAIAWFFRRTVRLGDGAVKIILIVLVLVVWGLPVLAWLGFFK